MKNQTKAPETQSILNTRSWFTVEKIDSATYSIAEYGQWMKLHSYLFIGTERSVLFDTGLGIDNIQSVVNSLTTSPVTVITTHAHWDHIGNHDLFSDIWIHPAEQDWLIEGYEKETEEIQDFLLERPFTTSPPPEFKIEKYRPPRCQATALVRDGDQVDLGNRRLVLFHTPGHSPGHICAHEPERGYLVTGDLLYQGTLLAGLEHSDPLTYFDSLQRIRTLPNVTQYLPGHGRLDIDKTLLDEAASGFEGLKRRGLLEKGTGVHPFKRLLIRL